MSGKQINFLISTLIGIIFLYFWIRIVNWNEFIIYLSNFRIFPVLIFSIFYLLAYILRSYRWKIIMKPIKNVPFSQVYRIFMSGLLINFLIPVRAGEIVKSLILKKNFSIRISRSLPTVFIDKLTDMFPIVLILVLFPLVTIQLNTTLYLIIFLIFLIYLLFLAFLYFSVKHQQKAINILNKLLIFVPRFSRKKLSDFFLNFVDGMAIMRGREKENLLIYTLTILAVLSEAVYIWVLFRSFGADIGYSRILFGYTLMNLTYLLPTPPGQIGSNQFLWVMIFSFALGADKDLTSAAVTASHLLTSCLIFLIGMVSLYSLKLKPADIFSQNPEIKENID
ncbi:MAG: flippase-like domain-containing protein [Candidatus Cloacimonetes bacterium]|nr:flippase-like domain-containing protein [Candidatus Cloacimonadota bacterium]